MLLPMRWVKWEGLGFLKEAAIKMPMISVVVEIPRGDWIGKLLSRSVCAIPLFDIANALAI
jgi:hypothetical protein